MAARVGPFFGSKKSLAAPKRTGPVEPGHRGQLAGLYGSDLFSSILGFM